MAREPAWIGRRLAAGLALGAAALAACSGGGIGGSGSPAAGGGIGGSGAPLAKGAVDRFGSVFVAGVEFGTAAATILLNGAPAGEADLRTGMIVRVHGTIAPDGRTGTAARIAYDATLAGPVELVDLAGGRCRILGRTVRMDAATTWHDAGPDLLKPGVILELCGHDEPDGSLRATYVRLRHPVFVPGAVELFLRGTVQSLNPGAGTFRVGGQAVDFRSAVLPPGGLSDGLPVAVRSVDGVVGGFLIASRVEAESAESAAADGCRAAREGVVASVSAGGGFVLDGLPARLGAGAVFERGDAGDLVPGVRVAVRGGWSGGVLVAEAVRFLGREPLLLEAKVESLDAAAGSIAVLGRVFRIDGHTRLMDERAESGTRFRVDDLRIGDRVALRGDSGDGALAGQIVRTNPSPAVAVEGVVEAAGAGSLIVVGVPVRLDAAPRGGGAFDSLASSGLDATALVGATVRVEGLWDGTSVVATALALTQ